MRKTFQRIKALSLILEVSKQNKKIHNQQKTDNTHWTYVFMQKVFNNRNKIKQWKHTL